jgi:signal transduction histidine kinase
VVDREAKVFSFSKVYSNLMVGRRTFTLLAGIICSSLLVSACGSPPNQEMDQAQGAIDAARAAGADRYATQEYEAAVNALKSAHDAVAARDYRLALNYALDSRERAQSAAKEAANQQVTLRSSAERRLAELTAMLDRAKRRLGAAQAAQASRPQLAAPRSAIAEAEVLLQKAGTGIQKGDYLSSQGWLSESATKLEKAIAEIDTVMKRRGRR